MIMLIKNKLQAVITYLQNKNIANIPGDPLKNALDNITQAQKYLQ
jgi:hypothetical protein